MIIKDLEIGETKEISMSEVLDNLFESVSILSAFFGLNDSDGLCDSMLEYLINKVAEITGKTPVVIFEAIGKEQKSEKAIKIRNMGE